MDFLESPNQTNPQTIDVSQKSTTNVAAPTYKSNEPDVTVESRLTNLLNKDNPFLIGAKTRAQQQAQSMGLQNSLMAATAGEKAAIESALPIAQQDAGFYQQRNLAGQQGEIESFLSGQQTNQQAGLYNVQGQIGSQLSAQESQQAKELQSLKGAQDYGLQELRGNQDLAQQQVEIEWNKMDLQARMQVEYDRMDADMRQRFDETANVIGSEYTQQLMNILQDPNWPDIQSRNNAIEMLNKQTTMRYQIASSAANANISWSWGPASIQTVNTSTVASQPIGNNINTVTNSAPTNTLSYFSQNQLNALRRS